MKRSLCILMSLLCLGMLCGCSGNASEKATINVFSGAAEVYSFWGEDETFSVQNGVVVLGDGEHVLQGGNFAAKGEEFADIAAYQMTFYTLREGERHILLTSAAEDKTGGVLDLNGDIGKISGEESVVSLADLQTGLYFELKTTSRTGVQNTWQIPMEVKAVLE